MNRYAQYSPAAAVDSAAQRLDARFKVLAVGILSFTVWQIDTLVGLALSALVVAAWVTASAGAAWAVLANLRRLTYVFLLIIAYYSWAAYSSRGPGFAAGLADVLYRSVLLGGKLAVLLAAAFWLYLSTAPMKIVDALTAVLKPLEKLRLPVRELSFTVGLVIRSFPSGLARIKDLHRNFRIRENLGRKQPGKFTNFSRALSRVIDTMVCYMHYTLHESSLLSLSLMARGYNPFRPLAVSYDARVTVADLAFLVLSTAVIVAAAWFY